MSVGTASTVRWGMACQRDLSKCGAYRQSHRATILLSDPGGPRCPRSSGSSPPITGGERGRHRAPVATTGPALRPCAASVSRPCPERIVANASRRRLPRNSRRTYVLDTSVLLSDPRAMTRFAEHEVVIPIVVISELEGKRHHPELGYFARSALRMLDELRVEHGRLDAPLPINDAGGTLIVELNHTDLDLLPPGFRLGDNDTRI